MSIIVYWLALITLSFFSKFDFIRFIFELPRILDPIARIHFAIIDELVYIADQQLILHMSTRSGKLLFHFGSLS